MAIQAQMPVQAQPPLQAAGPDLLALLTGKPVEARVVASALEGLTQILIGRDLVKLNLPSNLPAGTPINLQVVGNGAASRLLVTPLVPLASQQSVTVANMPIVNLPPPLLVEIAPGGMPIAVGSQAGGALSQGQPAMPGSFIVQNFMPTSASGPMAPDSALAAQLQAGVRSAEPGTPGQASAAPNGAHAANGAGANTRPLPAPMANFPATSMPASANGGAVAGGGVLPARAESVGGLLAGLAATQSRLGDVPQPVVAVMRQVLEQQLTLGREKLTGKRLQQALQQAGLSADGGDGDAVKLGMGGQRGAGPGDELRQNLSQLRAQLSRWLGQEETQPVAPVMRQPVPQRAGPPRAGRIEIPQPPLETADPKDLGRRLLEQTDEALNHLRPSNNATPERAQREAQAQPPRAEWTGALPMFLGHEAGIAQFHVSRDGGGDVSAASRAWQVRFAINFSAIGEVGAHVLMRGKRASVMIWAERDDTAEALEAMLPELDAAFAQAGIHSGSIQCRRGLPKPPPIATGGLVDSTR